MAKKKGLELSDEKLVSLANRNLWFGPQSKVSDAQFRLAQESAGKGGDDYTEEDDKKVKIPKQPWEDDPSGGGGGGGGGNTAAPGSNWLDYLRTPRPGQASGYGSIIRQTGAHSDPRKVMNWQQPIFGFNQAQQQGLLGPGPGSPMSQEDFLRLSGLLSPLGANTIA